MSEPATRRRSWLLVPASGLEQVERAARCGTDVIVLDLVEFIGEQEKTLARADAKELIRAAGSAHAEVFVQVDAESAPADLDAYVWPGLAGLVMSRAESPRAIIEIADVLTRLETQRGVLPNTLQIVAALETARGNHAAYEIACAAPRVVGLTLGRADLVMDLRPEPSGEIHLMPYLMQRLVTIAGAAGVTPIGAWWRAPDRGLSATPENTYEAAKRGRAIGFKGAMCTFANQVEPLNRAYPGCSSKGLRHDAAATKTSTDSASATALPPRPDRSRRVRRSGLTMPVVTRRFVDHAWHRGCDFIVLDLEDSVPQHLKAHARSLVKEAIANVAKGGAEVFARINHDTVQEDLEGVVWPGLSRVKYPKAEHAHEVRVLDEIITRLERERGIAPGTVEIDPSIETALGVSNAFEIAGASARVREFGATTGGYDLSRDLGVEMFVGFDQFVYAKGEAELAARALGLGVRAAPFMANTTGSVSDGNFALRQAEAARRCGLRLGGGGLNPAVVESHNIGFTPTADELTDARRVLEQYARLQATGEKQIETEGRLIDRYEAKRARELIEWAASCAARDREKAEAAARVRAARAAGGSGE